MKQKIGRGSFYARHDGLAGKLEAFPFGSSSRRVLIGQLSIEGPRDRNPASWCALSRRSSRVSNGLFDVVILQLSGRKVTVSFAVGVRSLLYNRSGYHQSGKDTQKIKKKI
ncbi:hypothetical protein CEXT_243361 [Caerostris extrusa]|uniref:Uncharacterized protein n=1 Tax=Caerostris extrusa TaxID=172846 RepID=A0AAV4WRJ1_CAEEX|nr:hypothetical protein CEXT_243361 [Caerostris extrusa]